MPIYARTCTNAACPEHGKLIERFAHAAEHEKACGPCEACGAPTDMHPSCFGPEAARGFQREWSRGNGGVERRSQAMVFQEAGLAEVKRDCPSMEFDVRGGEATPIFRNDSHHRRCMKELSAAKRRYTQERDHQKAQARSGVNKADVVRSLKKQAGIDT